MLVGVANILAVGTRDKKDLLEQLPLKVVTVDRAKEAAACLKKNKFSSLISKWNLEDLPGGEFIRRFKNARPDVPTVAFIEPGNDLQEAKARELGVNLVLPDDVDETRFMQSICTLLNLSEIASLYDAGLASCSEFVEI